MSQWKGQPFQQRLRWAWAGLRAAWRDEASLRTHALATLAVLGALALIRAPAHWWAIMALTVGLVVACELMNTAIEALADHLHPARHPAIGLCKDVAAGAVLISSVTAMAVGVAFVVDQLWPWLLAWLP